MRREDLAALAARTLRTLELPDLPPGARLTSGKVRDVVAVGDELLITTTDRISAFDRVLATVPVKGEVLNTLTLFWMDRTADIVPNHLLERVSSRTVRAARCEVVPVEVVVRGCLTGSALRDYQAGRPVSGIRLPPGMRPGQRFATPLLTPSTKEAGGRHDRPVSREELLAGAVVPRGLWEEIERTALALFRRGSEVAAANGLILVDTKYEFGLRGGNLTLVDEVHTPDSSRYWYADTYDRALRGRGAPARAGQGIPAAVAARARVPGRRRAARHPRRGARRGGLALRHGLADHHGDGVRAAIARRGR